MSEGGGVWGNNSPQDNFERQNRRVELPVTRIGVSCYSIPTASPESDGTFEWQKTTLLLVEAEAGGIRGIGYSYADTSTGLLIKNTLKDLVEGEDALDIPYIRERMICSTRNLGKGGILSMAISAIDAALWDLKSKLVGLPLVALLGKVHNKLPLYGSGGFTSYSLDQFKDQLEGWAKHGITRFKIKIGRDIKRDQDRVKVSRKIIGNNATLMVDADGAYTVKEALAQAYAFREHDVKWFEEPISSDNLEGLQLIRKSGLAGMDITAGEYGHDLTYFQRMLTHQSVDVLQADATRCLGITGLLKAGALCEAFQLPLSTNGAPALHLHAACAITSLIHAEYFFDHVRIEQLLFDDAINLKNGCLYPDLTKPGMGLDFKYRDAEKFKIA